MCRWAWGRGLLPLPPAPGPHPAPSASPAPSLGPGPWAKPLTEGRKSTHVHLACWDHGGSLLLPGCLASSGQAWPLTLLTALEPGVAGAARTPGGLVPELVVPTVPTAPPQPRTVLSCL